MIIEPPAASRTLRTVSHSFDLAVLGGGLSGVCCAIAAARAGIKVVLVQDRPVLGGNASSEVRLWILGATSHMGNNNRWAREGGVIDEILVENMHRNPEGNPLIVDAVMLELVLNEPNITLLLNTAVHDLEKSDDDKIKSVRAFCSQNSTCYEISAPLFCDASGDGIVGFLAGAAFRIGAESRDEFGEKFAPAVASTELLGHSMYFYSKDTGPGYIRENYAWPFFGYTHRTAPYQYDEQRYFWPLLVQGRGDERLVNRWAPFYTHSNIKGFDKTWLLWPLYRHQRWSADGVAQQKHQFLFFLYWSLEQKSLTNPAATPAHKTHLWPLFSAWDNGAGRRQVQALSPLEVFLPGNEPVRQLWSPLFAVYRYERSNDDARHSLFWNAVTYRHSPAATEFHLGPLFSVQANAETRRIAFGHGLFGWQRRPGEHHGRLFLFDFHPKAAIKTNQAAPP